MIKQFADWLSQTWLSSWFQNHLWVVPTSQSIHIVALSVVFASASVINMRLLGIGRSKRSIRQTVATHVPWIWYGLVVLLLTGAIQTITEPARQFLTAAFWAKMAMIIIVVSLTAGFASLVRVHADGWDRQRPVALSARVFGITSTMLWLAIISCGRLIGYTWSGAAPS